MQNLRDKLLKAGLVSEEQAKHAEQAAKPPPRPPPRAEPRPERIAHEPRRSAEPESRIPKLPPLPGSKAHQKLLSRRQLELDRKIRDAVLAAQVPLEPGDQTFYFVTRKQRLRRLELSAQMHRMLEAGELAVVERPDPAQIEHALVPSTVAVELLALSEKVVRFLNRPEAKVGFLSEDDLKDRQQAEASGEAETREAEETRREDERAAQEIAAEGEGEGEGGAA